MKVVYLGTNGRAFGRESKERRKKERRRRKRRRRSRKKRTGRRLFCRRATDRLNAFS